MRWDCDGIVGGCDDDGHCSDIPKSGEYNRDGDQETAHTDPVYIAIFTSWVDDWLLGGDRDIPTIDGSDGVIGGYDWVDLGDGIWNDMSSWNGADPGFGFITILVFGIIGVWYVGMKVTTRE